MCLSCVSLVVHGEHAFLCALLSSVLVCESRGTGICSTLTPFSPPQIGYREFDLPKRTLDLMYTQALVWYVVWQQGVH